jgi:protein-tyrosine phosphatase
LIDLHSHILPGLDDGARDLDESLAMVEASLADGVETIAATPHVRGDYPTRADDIHRLVAKLQAAVDSRRLSVQIVPGAEIAADFLGRIPTEELRRFALGGNPEFLLIETPYTAWSAAFVAAVRRVFASGFTPVIAHPERNPDVQASIEPVRTLVRAGALVQVTAASLDGRFGRATQATARRLLDAGVVHLLASDAHGPSARGAGLSAARDEAGEALGSWLTEDVPAAILARRPLPPRPEPMPRRRFRLRLRR